MASQTDIDNEIKPKDLLINNLASLEPIKSDIQHLIEIIQGKMNSHNSDRTSVIENNTNSELQQTIAAIKAELAKIDNIEASGLYEQLKQIEKLALVSA